MRSLRTKILTVSDLTSLTENDQKLFKQAQPGDLVIGTEETIFHVQGGGQPSDTGSMTLDTQEDNHDNVPLFEVLSVRRGGNGAIHHHGRITTNSTKDFPSSSTPETKLLKHGTTVSQKIDSEKRDLYSRIHTAGHLLGTAVRQHSTQIPNFEELRGQHFPDAAWVEFRGKIRNELIEPIQKTTHELVARDLAVQISWLSETEMREKQICVPEDFPYFSAEGTRVVEIEGWGGYPCSGTHVSSTAVLGRVVITRVSVKKGVSKVYYEVRDADP